MDNFDLLLKNNAPRSHVRKHLTDDTMIAIKQIKRITLAKRFVIGIFVLALLLLLLKWINNDLLYLMQILLQKFTIVKTQSLLYWSAFFESLPKQQFITVFIIACFLIGWKQIKTPKMFAASLLIVITTLGFSGYTYAEKSEQKKLQILREYINESGRKAFDINIQKDQCNSINNPNLTNQFEIKKAAKISSSDAIKIIEAACNINETETFLRKTFSNTSDRRIDINTTIVSLISENSDNQITIKPSYINGTQETYLLTKETKIYKNQTLVSQKELQTNTIILPVLKRTYATIHGGDPISTELVGIAILPSDPAFHWYDLTLQHSVTQIETCLGNPNDHCSFTGGIDFFPSGGGEGDTKNPLYIQTPDGETKTIAGVITEIHDKYVKIKSSSGRIFTINFGSNPTEEFNRNRAQYFENKKATTGDTLLVTYNEAANKHETTIAVNQIFNAILMLEVINKTDPIKKY